jgi:hypothetical protein
MSKILRNILIIVCIISCVSIAAGPLVEPTAETKAKRAKIINDQYATILVEAFVVEVRLSALFDSGVNPIGEKSNSVSIENILNCLQDENIAKISSGMKVAIQKKETGTIELEETIYLEQERPIKTNEESGPVVSKTFRPYKISKSLEVSANVIGHNSVIEHNRISISYAFSLEEAEKVSSKNEAPPTIAQRLWIGKVCLEMGKASIVGATQDEKKAVFLILCADVRDS